ncbi:MAG: aspartate--tRNA(Asn) ligase [Candidatus Pacebacteria bacterium]|jgi:nondiscriminating aspartyl-tRNA synthetase|nr:aspartate--tRNA(Asn) ligase [Candidatus Paceibacterota bacterium]MBP9780408.1 aspartate--tRNA(Asn) ligase [Candidatus Paceibacterota bacterium]MDQ5949518.1 Aspartate--tRNA ligase [Patescibacteria group bacterium]MDQ5962058.1 Aspartate--tRNA ligase [Patescibacteria group bacterium]
MSKRIYIKDLSTHKGEEVLIKGWVHVRRDQGKMIFFDFRDMTGIIQGVILSQNIETLEIGKQLRQECVVEVTGKVNERPPKNINPEVVNGEIELEILTIKILAMAETLPFDMSLDGFNLDLTTELNNRALTLRHPKIQAIFKIKETIIDSFRTCMKNNMFFEFQAPSIVPATAEGGAEVFKINYFNKEAYLSQSPQLYKQIVMTAFERCFSVNKVFRAEPSSTTRHITEIVSLDAEMAFIESWTDVKDMAEETIRFIIDEIKRKNSAELKMLDVELPTMIDSTPTLSLREAHQKIFDVYGRDNRGDKDLSSQDEVEISEIIKKETGSDFVFVYGYPTKQKPFYVYPNEAEPEYNEGVDLICRGRELLSGGRRINDYNQLTKHVTEWGLDPKSISMFLQSFKYGVPPEGGFAFGAERITMQFLNLVNIRQACMFPRDMNRIDERLNDDENAF